MPQVTLDAHGWVVWFARLAYDEATANSTGETGYAVWDRAPDSYNLVVLRDNNDYWDMSPSYLAEISEITPLGATLAARENECDGGEVSAFNQLSHECRVDTSDRAGGFPALSFAYSVRDDFGNASASGLRASDSAVADYWEATYGAGSAVRFAGMKIVAWNRTSGAAPVELYDLFDYINPADAAGLSVDGENPNLMLMPMRCTGMDAALDGVDYHHLSSLAIGTADNYVVTSRNLDAVLSLARDGRGLQWTLSPTIASDFTFATDADKFYDPHDVTQTSNTTLTLVDDGNARPACNFDDTSHQGCFSRAIELELDFETMEAKVTWQFEFPTLLANTGDLREAERGDVFNEVGGSVTRLGDAASNASATDDFLVAFTAIDDSDDNATSVGYETFVYQVARDGAIVSALVLPALPSWGTAGRYRVEPTSTVYGESSTCPFAGGC